MGTNGFRRIRGWTGILAAVCALHSLGRSQEAATPDDEVREFTLFTGANLKIIDGEFLRPVLNVTDKGLFVDFDGQARKLDFDDVNELWIDREMKLNAVYARINDMKMDMAFSEGLVRVPIWGTVAAGTYSADRGSLDSSEQPDIKLPPAMNSGNVISGPDRSSGWKGLSPTDQRDAGFDAWKVSFKLSSAHALPTLYAVLITDYRDPARSGDVLRKFHLQTIDGISAEPKEITLLQEGFPPGFQVEDSDIYLYSMGREIPTNLSEKQVALTRDEAMQYLILEYMIGHKDATLPPRPMWVWMPPEVKTLIRESETNPVVRLDLDVKGRVINLVVDSEGEEGIAPEITAAFRDFRFYPAFENGRPIEGSYTLRPKELLR
ncbi:MAG: hypothetical protein R3F07_11100 [Opitutaceae bacterium]